MGKVTVTLTGDATRLIREMKRVQDNENKIAAGSKKIEKSGKRAFGTRAVSQLKSTAAGYVGIAAVIATVTAALAAMNAERKKGIGLVETAGQSLKKLQQLSSGDKKELVRMVTGAKKSVKQGMSLAAAGELQFTLESMGLAKHREMFAKTIGLVETPEALAGGVSTLINALGKKETGGAEQVLNKLFAASAVSKTTVEDFAPAASMAAQTIKMIKGSDEEFLAVLAHMSKAAKSADVAATQIDAFASVLSEKKLGGRGLTVVAQELQKQGIDPIEFFTRKEARKGYLSMISLMPEIKKTEAELKKVDVETGTEKDYFKQLLIAGKGEKIISGERRLRTAKYGEELAHIEATGKKAIEQEAGLLDMRARSFEQGEGNFTRWLKTFVAEKLIYVGASGEVARKAAEVYGDPDKNKKQWVETFEKTAAAAEKIEKTFRRNAGTD